MKTYLKLSTLAVSLVFGLAACSQPPEVNPQFAGSPGPSDGSAFVMPDRLESFSYSANGKTYRLQTKWDSMLRARITSIHVERGPALTGDLSEDAEVQNTIRDAFRTNGICEEGKHPGLLGIGYGFGVEHGAWIARIRCSGKNQANI